MNTSVDFQNLLEHTLSLRNVSFSLKVNVSGQQEAMQKVWILYVWLIVHHFLKGVNSVYFGVTRASTTVVAIIPSDD